MNELISSKPILKNKIVLLGDVFVGKTSISVRFSKNEFKDFQESTSGAVFVTHTVEAEKYLMQFDNWDTAGQERFRALGKNSYILFFNLSKQLQKSLKKRVQRSFFI